MKTQEKCPYCGSNEFVEGVQSGYAAVSQVRIFAFKSQALYHIFCLKCGAVVKSYVKKPEKLVIEK